MKVSFFETGHYRPPQPLPAEWPVPPAAYDHEAGAQSYRGMVERLRFVEELGFDWVSVAEHHYSPHRLTPAPIVSAAHLAACAKTIKIAVLGPIVSQSNPVQVAEELAMLDVLSQGRLVVGLLRGITGEYLSYGLNPTEARERTTEAMELILKAWTEPQPFGWQGRHFRFRTVSVWPRPLQQPHPQTYALGGSREILRVRRTASSRPGCRLWSVRRGGQGDPLLPRRVCGIWMAAGTGADHLPSEYPARGIRRRGARYHEGAPGSG